ncbi:ArsR/SmtB family transcription factor [Flexivirga meconopsidis]|uniref:ArsR/SmtB family transcription factor n=1 Tax=Flexivirga meconopsidis TaxID=2977121 RepID=UPI00223E9639
MGSRTRLFEELSVVGKAFGSPRRLEIIELLAQSPHSVEEIARALDQRLSTVSAHLQILRASRLVGSRRDGTRVIYRLAGEDVADLFAALGVVARTHSPDVTVARRAYLGAGDDGPEVITRAELMEVLGAPQTTLLDIRPSEEFEQAHLPGAVSMPLEKFSGSLQQLPAGNLIAYCRGAYCLLAHDAVALLTAAGREAKRLEDGILEWRLAGLPLERTAQGV